MKNLIITTDSELAAVVDTTLAGEKYLNEHDGQIDLDDDDAVAAMLANKEKFNMAVTLLCEINEALHNEELKGIINDLYEFDTQENFI